MSPKPVIFLAFANDKQDLANYLRYLPKELEGVRKALDVNTRGEGKRYEIIKETALTIDLLTDTLLATENTNQIVIFHYGGHANSFELLVENYTQGNQTAHGKGLIDFFKTAKANFQKNLQVVFLNGCCTEELADELKTFIPVVIGTVNEVKDQVASEFAAYFYYALANGHDIKTAFEAAQSKKYIQSGSQRGRYRENSDHEPTAEPWQLYYTDEKHLEWKLEKVEEKAGGNTKDDFPAIELNKMQKSNYEFYIKECNNAIKLIRKKVKEECLEEIKRMQDVGISKFIEMDWEVNQIGVRRGEEKFENFSGYMYNDVKTRFQDTNKKIFLLGEAGAGKTTSLSFFIKDLLDKGNQWIAPVFLRLSSWKATLKMNEWIVNTIKENYDVDKEIAKILLGSHILFICFDGLDELDERLRQRFINKLTEHRENQNILNHGNQNILITCRTNEFENVLKKLNIDNSHVKNFTNYKLRPVSDDKILTILNDKIKNTDLVETIRKNNIFPWLRTTIALCLFIKTHENGDNRLIDNLLKSEGEQELYHLLWDNYLDNVFKEKFDIGQEEERPKFYYSKCEIKRWMVELAKKTPNNSFFIEDIQPIWLNNRLEEFLYIFTTRIISGILVAIAAGFQLSHPFEFVADGILGGFIISLIYLLQKQEKRSKYEYWELSRPKRVLKTGLYILIYTLGMLALYIYHGSLGSRLPSDKILFLGILNIHSTSANVGILLAFFFIAIIGLRAVKQSRLNDIRLYEATSTKQPNTLPNILSYGLGFGLIISLSLSSLGSSALKLMPNSSFLQWVQDNKGNWGDSAFLLLFIMSFPLASIVGFLMGWSNESTFKLPVLQKKDRSKVPNLGMRKTFIYSIYFSLFMLLIMVLYWCFLLPFFLLDTGIDGVYKGGRSALAGVLLMFLWAGGLDIMQHWVLRLILFVRGRAPLLFQYLLQDLEKLSLVLRTGSHYHFLHLTLLNYLANQQSKPIIGLKKHIALFIAIITIIALILYPILFMVIDHNTRHVQKPGYINFYSFPSEVFEIDPIDKNQFSIKKKGKIEIEATGKIKVGDFTGYIPATGTEAGFFAMRIGNTFDRDSSCYKFSHGCIIYKYKPQNKSDTTWQALFPTSQKNLLGHLGISPYKKTIAVDSGFVIRFDINDKELQNNSGAFEIKMSLMNDK